MRKLLQIVLIEDDPIDEIRLRYELDRSGLLYEAIRVETKIEFERRLQASSPDLILSDHGLPLFDGFSALEMTRKKNPALPFIFVSGSNDQATIVNMFESGATGFVFKNRLHQDLIPAIQDAIAGPPPRQIEETPAAPGDSAAPAAAPAPIPAEGLTSLPSPVASLVWICPNCKRVGNPVFGWSALHDYFQSHPTALVSLGLCPPCRALRYSGSI